MSDGILPASLTEPMHDGVTKAMFLTTTGAWAGGIVAGSSDGLVGFAFGGAIMATFVVIAMMIMPHPTVIVDDWFAAEGVEDAEQRGDGY